MHALPPQTPDLLTIRPAVVLSITRVYPQYRLIAFVHYLRQIVYIKHILTHEDYDEGEWKL
jgi:mRNA-degrading endonuclease HigB of HigAB toxin-antitoxin module